MSTWVKRNRPLGSESKLRIVLVFRSLRKTVAPETVLDEASKTVPDTPRWPIFCATARGESSSNPTSPAGTIPAVNTANATPVSFFVRPGLTRPPLALQMARLHPDRRRLAPTPAVRRRPLRILSRTHRRRPHRLPLLRPVRCQVHSRIQGTMAWQTPLVQTHCIL